jgi:hypothetical protein
VARDFTERLVVGGVVPGVSRLVRTKRFVQELLRGEGVGLPQRDLPEPGERAEARSRTPNVRSSAPLKI